MVMEIQFLDKARSQNVTRFQMRSVDDGWALPEVILAPVDKLPHVCRLAVAVTGTPTVVAGRIQASFYSREFNPPSPLSERKAIGGGLVRDAGPLPADAVCDLTVTVGYKDSDGRGRPTGKEHTLTSTCKLFSTPLPEQPPEIEVEQREGKIVVLGEEARIVLKVRYARDERPPTLALEYPSTVLSPDDASFARLAAVLPDLRDGLVAALGVTPQRQEVAGDRVVFHMNFRPTLAQATRNALEQLGEPLVIALVATLPQAKPVRCLVKLEPKKVQFNGWLVIDFGTTNSSVTVYDDRGKTPQEGLHPEQEEVLRGLLSGWLAEPASEAMHDGRRFETDWKRLRDLLKPAGAVGRPAADDIASGPAVHFYEAQARLELALRGMREEFRRAVSVRLHEFYHEALRTPTLRMKNIYPVQLSPGRDQKDIPSDVEVRELGEVVGVTMGEQARAAHMEAIGAAAADGIRAIESRFHASPKRYFGTEHEPFRVTIGDRTQYVSTDQLMQAGWRELVAQTERARAEDRRFSHGAFRSAVITYPTVAPPVVRQRIRGLIERLGITDVRTDYDEAVAAAIFYFVREYGGAPEIGLESFRARSSQALSKEGSHQNVLVFDIGGGTTDVALIQLRLTEEPVFEPGEDRGAGGRFYKITPQLLCSSGHLQLGGELITLHIFRLLKAVLADHILTLVQDGKLRSDHFKAMLTDDAATEFVDEKRRYKPDSIVKQFLKNETNIDVINTSEALDLAELVLPTRWDRPAAHPETAPVQAFYALWELADHAKMALGGRVEGGGGPPPFLIEQEQFRKLLDQCVPGQRYQCDHQHDWHEDRADFVDQMLDRRFRRLHLSLA